MCYHECFKEYNDMILSQIHVIKLFGQTVKFLMPYHPSETYTALTLMNWDHW